MLPQEPAAKPWQADGPAAAPLASDLLSLSLSPPSSIGESKCNPWGDPLQGGGKRPLKEGDTRAMITAG